MKAIIRTYWSSLAWRGLASVAFGLVALAWPSIALGPLTVLLGVYASSDGVLAFLAGVPRGYNPHRWLLFLDGLLGVGAGLVLLLSPSIGLPSVILVGGIRALLVGAIQMGEGWQLRTTITAPWLYVLSGSLTVVFGVALFLLPGITVFVLATLFGIYALFFGTAFLSLAYSVRKSDEPFLVDAGAT